MPDYILFFKNFSENYLSLDIIFFDMIILKTRLFSEIGERGRQKLGKQDSFDFTVSVNDYLKISVAKFSHNLSADTAGHDTVF